MSQTVKKWALVMGMVALLVPLAAKGQVAVTKIHDVQGNGSASPLINQTVTIEGVVVGDFQQAGGLGGFYVEEEDPDQDADPATSEGVFVFNSTVVALGDLVQISGRVSEFGGQTQISGATVAVLDTASPPATTDVTLPVTELSDLERFEGMLVTFPQALFISEFFNYDRFGEIVLTTTRQYQGTHVAEPGTAANAVAAANRLARITLDDGSNTQNPTFNRHPNGAEFTLSNTFRGGDIVQNVTGVLGEGFGLYRIQPTAGADYVNANPRPTSPDPIPGRIRVASFNVLNYFTHLDLGPDNCGPTGNLECRGADTAEELARQQDKLVAGIIALDADVVGIQEIENDIHDDDGSRAHDAILTLVEALNDTEGPGTWAWTGPANHYNNYPVRNEIIYKPASVTPIGVPVALVSEAFDRTLPGEIEPVGRPPLAQNFRQTVDQGSRQPFSVVVNHFKSKSSSCGPIGDPDTGGGQGNCNLTRVAQSHALLDFIGVLQENSSGVLAIGDFNSYAMEDPIDVLKAGRLIELVERFEGADAYSFVFDGQLGYLDSAFATRSMSNRVEGLTTFHINADEPDILDYDMTFKSSEQDALYEPLPYRVSDHDPLIIGLSFGGPAG